MVMGIGAAVNRADCAGSRRAWTRGQVGVASDLTAVRDSKNPAGGMLIVPEAAWRAFRAMLTD